MPPSRPRDSREFVRVAVTLPDDPKLLDTTDVPRCGWLYVTGLLWARKQRTDGVLRPEVVVRDASVPRRLAGELVRVGMWHEPGHDCDRCEQPPARHVVVHDYLQHQQSRDESDAARDAARKAAEARWSRKGANRNASGNANRTAERNAEVEVEVEVENSPLLTFISRLAGSDARVDEPLPAGLVESWREIAGSLVDVNHEARTYLAMYADRPARDERSAWIGHLRKARERAEQHAAAAPRPLGCDACDAGWMPPTAGDDRPRPCPTCRPHLRAV